MQLITLKKLIFEKNIFAFLRLGKHVDTVYRTSFVTAANSSGLLASLQQGTKSLEQLQHHLQLDGTKQEALSAWLECGVRLKELTYKNGQYALKGKLSKHLAKQENQIAAAMFEEAIRYHYDALLSAPTRMQNNHAYQLADQDGSLIARSSQILEPFVEEAIEWCLKRVSTEPKHILEVGCGAGQYLVYLHNRLPACEITAIDYQLAVVEQAQRTLSANQITNIDLRHESFFELAGESSYDLITLHNNIYYFPQRQRMQVLNHAYKLLKPGGQLLMTTSCQGGSSAISALNLWFSLSDVGGVLPDAQQLTSTLKQAQFSEVQHKRLMPGESYFAFAATK
ncbi:class I SAM-dependent methyltransferase [Pseudoalteromonas sp. JBTF-M23]|uniref:Class I SAM-dependent methyltransferase n=1 Tax=Pseudoalteromonas caenipelagi TaxID=2726988 RepID=A0A849VBD8_9GAMM|nr:class I SAM-dependent methyltransferase [Pseudoalteromonas caenipelagi]NOU49893.1 class I SAM-dependent methyltransferase [Pseudoalteromonas caenipelagi]